MTILHLNAVLDLKDDFGLFWLIVGLGIGFVDHLTVLLLVLLGLVALAVLVLARLFGTRVLKDLASLLVLVKDGLGGGVINT